MKSIRLKNVIDELKGNKSALFSVAFLAFIILISIFAFLLPMDPDATNTAIILQTPSSSHIFGTDELGRDYLARTIYGGRVSLIVGILAMLISTSIGIGVGTISGYFGGKIDNLLMRFVDIISSIPWMILVTVVSIFLKPGFQAIIIVIGLFSWMETARLVRAETLSVKQREYVLYANSIGESSKNIIFRHIIPSVFPTIIIASTSSIANAIMTESSLSFLGLGIQQPMSSWGNLLQNAQTNLQNAPYMAILPGVLIILTIYSFNKLGNVLRVFAEPRTSGGGK
ncbi:ABC transporter permease [Clostridium manihotivorum]|uniref:Peptide ABC transporter permease n=1 Tax=Clostridium manihotivorum TaxID=2320868 RepID=A0A410DVJ6_9CLOT|nr:ABC transporter permease [Clostridium manihotivorum]QAA32972.1 peptide ABC transporter permease [Clostridium manihotivorum]